MSDTKEGEEGEETVYDEEGREGLVEDGGISPEEAGFMKGYEEADESEEEKEEEKEEGEDEEKKE